jgi:hypothetical protein
MPTFRSESGVIREYSEITLRRGDEIIFGGRKCLVVRIYRGDGTVYLSPLGGVESVGVKWSILRERFTRRASRAVPA